MLQQVRNIHVSEVMVVWQVVGCNERVGVSPELLAGRLFIALDT
jgi:hypothetical protein